MVKRNNILEISNSSFSYPDSGLGSGYGKLGSSSKISLGTSYPLGGEGGSIYDEEPIEFDEEENIDDDLLFNKQLLNKFNGDNSNYGRDIGHKGNRMSNFTGAYTNLAEWDQHTTPIMKGISPNITFRNNQGSGKVGKGSSLNGITYPKIQQSPYKRTGTQYGTSRAPLPMYYEDNYNPIFSLEDMLDNTSDYALLKFKNQENKIKKIINETYYY